jgi:hypothetical protein
MLSPENEGLRIRDFGLGFSPISEDDRHAYLLYLMTPSSEPEDEWFAGAQELLQAAATPERRAGFGTTRRRPLYTEDPPTDEPPHELTDNSTTAEDPPTGDPPTGDTPPASTEPTKNTTVADPAVDFTPPPAYDARDVRAGEATCKAYDALDQSSCNSCYAFAAAAAFSARLCRSRLASTVGNVVISPQVHSGCTVSGPTPFFPVPLILLISWS